MGDFDFGAQSQAEENAIQSSQDNWRKNQAMNALAKQYGPTAGDPAATAQVQTNFFNSQVDPLKVQQAQQEAAAHAANIAQYGAGAGDADNTSKNIANQQSQSEQQRQGQIRAVNLLSSVPPEQRGALYDQVVAPNAAAWGIDPAHVQPTRDMLVDPNKSDAVLQHIGQALQSASPVTGTPTIVQNPDGTYSRMLSTKDGGAVSQQIGGTPVMAAATQQRANTGAFSAQTRAQQGWARIGVAQQNADTGTYRADVTANNSEFGGSGASSLPTQGARVSQNIPPNGIPVTVKGPDGTPISFDESTAANFIQNAFPGATITSAARSQANNSKLPGSAPDSEHLYGQAADLTLPKGVSFSDFKDTLKQAGLPVTELTNVTPSNAAAGEGAHVHWAWGDAAKTIGQSNAANPASTVLFDRLPPKGKQEAISQATQLVNQTTMLSNTNTLIASTRRQISPYTVGAGSTLSSLPGSVQKDLANNLSTLQANEQQAVIAAMKNNKGQTGIGRVLQSEANNFQKVLGSINQDQSVKALDFHLTLLQQSLQKMQSASRGGFQTMYGVSPEHAIGQPELSSKGGGPKAPAYSPQQNALLKKYGVI